METDFCLLNRVLSVSSTMAVRYSTAMPPLRSSIMVKSSAPTAVCCSR